MRLVALSLWLVIAITPSVFAQDAVAQEGGEELEQATNEQLIDRLTAISEFGVGFHPTAWVSGFVAVDDEPSFDGGIIGSIKPVADPAMKELVRRGLKALPDLLAHLSDGRPSSLQISAGGFAGGTWHSDEYDDRPPTGKSGATEVNTGKRDVLEKAYTLHVGDLCYVAIGQIVNRRFHALRYQPSGCYVINSPVQTPALAQAVIAQWTGLTADEHRQLLNTDCLNTTRQADWGAWQRIRVYYPELAEEIALRLLARPLYDYEKLREFLQEELAKEQDESKWQPLIDGYAEINGVACKEVLPRRLYEVFWVGSVADTPERIAGRAVAARILAKLYPDFDHDKPAFLNAASVYEQTSAVKAMSSYPSSKIDQAVFDLFSRATRFRLHEDEWFDLAQVVEASLARLGSVHYEIDGRPDSLFQEIKRLIVEREPNEENWNDVRYVALQAAIRFFPERSQEVFDNVEGAKPEWTRIVKLLVLRKPTAPQPWMVDYLTSLLDDTTHTDDFYGPLWDSQPVRVCDEAAKTLADNYLHVRFEYEQNPEYLTQQIAKIRRVLAGEQNVAFEPPPELLMPTDVPVREAARTMELNSDLGPPYAFSDKDELWIGDGFQGRGGWAYDTLQFDVNRSEVVERTSLDQWEGGVNILDNGPAQLAYCYNTDEGGKVFIRDLPTGRLVSTVQTPFHDLGGPDDQLEVRNLGDATISGIDGNWMLAFTEDLKLHSIDLTSGEHRVEWQYQRKSEDPDGPQEFFASSIIGLHKSPRVLVQDDFGDAPLHIWDQAARSMKVVEKAPPSGWKGGWGQLAWNCEYDNVTLWNLESLRQIPVPKSDDPILQMTCDGDLATLFVLRGGAIDVFRLAEGERVEPLQRLLCPAAKELLYVSLVVSTDERTLFVHGWRKRSDDEAQERGMPVIAIYDVTDLTD